MGLTDKGIREFGRLQAQAEPVIGSLADHAVRIMWEAWSNSGRTGLGPHEERLSELLERAGGLDNDQYLTFFQVVGDIEQHAFIVGFETARRLMGGAR